MKKNWSHHERAYKPVRVNPDATFCKTLPGGIYQYVEPPFDIPYLYLRDTAFLTEGVMESPEITEVFSEIERFLNLRRSYEKLNLDYKRGMIFHGVPGGGKSTVLKVVSNFLIEQGSVVFMMAAHTIEQTVSGIHLVHEKNPEKLVTVLIEDMDAVLRRSEEHLLSVIDGAESFRNVIYLATTNYLDRLPDRIRNRPSRFDKVLEIQPPNQEMRREFIKNFVRDLDRSIGIANLVAASEGFTFAHLKELVISTVLFDADLNETADRLRGASFVREAEDQPEWEERPEKVRAATESPFPDDSEACASGG